MRKEGSTSSKPLAGTQDIKVLFIAQEFSNRGGGGVYANELVKSLEKLGVDVHVMCPGPKTKIKKLSNNVTLHTHKVIALPLLKVPSHHLQVRFRSRRIIKKYSVNIIHSNNYSGAYSYKKVPMLATIHHLALDEVINAARFQRLLYRADCYFEKRTIKRATVILVDSHIVKRQLEKNNISKDIKLLPCGIDLNVFKNQPSKKVRQNLGLDKDEILLYFPGGARAKRKGALNLISALKKVQYKKFKCLVSGSIGGREIGWRHEFQSALKSSKLADQFIFLGEIERSELPKYYSATDIVVYPSILEGFGLPALEALACEKSLICTKTGEMPYIVKNGQNGLIVDVDNPDQLCRALDKLMGSGAARQKLERNARSSIDNYSWDSLAMSVLNLYKQTLGVKA
jgi:glycosyltransferase involved in cell wall biosynthesis